MINIFNSKFVKIAAVLVAVFAVVAIAAPSADAASCTFTRALTVGSTGGDVMCLQQYLNGAGFTVSAFGAGSPGAESSYFGEKTRAAVSAWQAAHGIMPTAGYFGSISRAKYDALMATGGGVSGLPAGCTSTAGFSPVTGVACNTVTAPVGLPAGCTSTAGFSPLSGVSCASGTGFPAGCTSLSGYSATTGLSCSTGGVVVPPSPTAGEGSITVTQRGSPTDGTDVKKGETRDVHSFDVKAVSGPVNVTKVDLQFDVRPWLYLSKIQVVVDGNVVSEIGNLTSTSFTELTAGSSYLLRVSGLNVPVARDTTKTFTVRVTALSMTDKTTTSGINVDVPANGVRAMAASGAFDEDPSSALTRTFDFLSADTGDVEPMLDVNTPAARNVTTSLSGTTPGVEMMRFGLKARQQDVAIDTLKFLVITSGPGVTQMFSEMWLADNNGARIATAQTLASTTIFTSIDPDLMIAKDATKTYRLMATVADASDFTAGSSASTTLTANTTNIVGEDTLFNTITVSGSNAVSNVATFFTASPSISGASGSVTAVQDTPYMANVNFAFTVTANGGSVYISKTPALAVATSSTAATSTLTLIDGGTALGGDTDNYFIVNSGSSRAFTMAGSMNNDSGTAGTKESKITGIRWSDDATTAATTYEFTTTSGLDALRVTATLTN